MTSLKTRLVKLEKSQRKTNPFADWSDEQLQQELERLQTVLGTLDDSSATSASGVKFVNRMQKDGSEKEIHD